MAAAAIPGELATLERIGAGVVGTVPAGRTAELLLVRLRLTRPDAGPPEAARAAVVVHAPPPHGTHTVAFVELMPGGGAAYAEAAAAPGRVDGPATITVETDADPAWPCRAVVRARALEAGAA